MVKEKDRVRSTASSRRGQVLDAGLAVFARSGYQATPVTEVATAAKISQGYVLRLFGTKLNLFVAVLDHCYQRICDTLAAAADEAAGEPAEAMLAAMGDAYAELIADRSLLILQVHAQSASDVPEIKAAMRRGLGDIVELARQRTGAGEEQVQRFMAFGQLCHLIVTADLDSVDRSWARTLTNGMRHVAAPRAGEGAG
ncbi:TetR/AcrR family transcriptional regulator [Streptomyces sp. NRRL F-5126]|uniref:TetR/AcrR family transcriptional regulator n=1 Tax=Streptomyces sp. NRRL F-5126 TaxID=1463857 RepID=UPI0004CC45D9|nr:helix-turn-helix domain-containing protein [Streptomyces sp. NRRL F-5126]